MNIIENNPYRTVGLLVGATAKEQERQVKRLNKIDTLQESQDSLMQEMKFQQSLPHSHFPL